MLRPDGKYGLAILSAISLVLVPLLVWTVVLARESPTRKESRAAWYTLAGHFFGYFGFTSASLIANFTCGLLISTLGKGIGICQFANYFNSE
jgi:hypothetical protein